MLIGVVGGGQLGQMLGLAGIAIGHRFRFLDPDPACPASAVGEVAAGAFDDPGAIDRFAHGLDRATFEFENVPAATLGLIAERAPLAPGVMSLRTAQDRILEKEFFRAHGLRVQAFEAVDSEAGLAAACGRVGVPGVLKTRSMGYDGKGQAIVRSAADVPAAWAAVGRVPCIYEAFVPFTSEASVVAVRAADGDVRAYPLCANEHRGGILHRTTAPAPGIDAGLAREAEQATCRVLGALGHVGAMAIEFFVTPEGLVANEMAPRVHNSGHWTIEGALTSQFENHVRAVAGEPLGPTDARGFAGMVNLVGRMPPRARLLCVPGAHLHDYGKPARPGRKLGHVNVCAPDVRVRDAQLAVLEAIVARGDG